MTNLDVNMRVGIHTGEVHSGESWGCGRSMSVQRHPIYRAIQIGETMSNQSLSVSSLSQVGARGDQCRRQHESWYPHRQGALWSPGDEEVAVRCLVQ